MQAMPCKKSGPCALYSVSLPGFTGVGPRRTNFSTVHNTNRRCRWCRAKNQACAHYTVSHSPDSPASGPCVRISVITFHNTNRRCRRCRATNQARAHYTVSHSPDSPASGPGVRFSVHFIVQTDDAGDAVQKIRPVHVIPCLTPRIHRRRAPAFQIQYSS